jgi:serine/threonine protein kinase/WD40 repeat protein/tetratricopeptide (TPR) repeat protein
MIDNPSQVRDPVEVLAEEFVERRRRGDVPSLKEYVDRYPDLADEIREVFPALVVMDEIDPRSVDQCPSLGGTVDIHGQPKIQQLGDFRILREVGRGGMGVVYEARQESLGRHVALKVLPGTFAGREQFRERFQREARAAARLHHTNIVPIFGVGEDLGVLYYAMQFIQGQSLDTVLEDVKKLRGTAPEVNLAEQATLSPSCAVAARGLLTGHFARADLTVSDAHAPQSPALPKPPTDVTRSDLGNQPEARYYRSIARLGAQAAEALAYAHAQGILHRDIKPSNLLLDAQGTLWITDFGLAKTEGWDDLTHSGELIGTLRYMAPERFEGKSDARTDVYALGVTLYEMLTLRPPFSASDRIALMGQITCDAPPGIRRLAPILPRDLETIVQKAMAREPAARYATAQEMALDLRRFLENRPIKARRSSAFELASRWCRRNPAVASLLGAVFSLLTCLAVGSTVAALRLNEKNKAVVAAEADGAEKLYESLVAQANASRYSHRVGQRFGTLDAVRRAARLVRERQMPRERLDELRNLAIAGMALPDFRTLRSWQGFSLSEFDWYADDQFRLYATRRPPAGGISLYLIENNEKIASLDGNWQGVRFSPGGRFLLASGNDRFRVWDVSGPQPRVAHEGEEHGFAFHPDGQHLLVSRRNGSLWVYDLETPSEKPSALATLHPPADDLALDPGGTRLLVIRAGKPQILDARTARVLATIPDSQSVEAPAWHPSGNYLALVTSEQNPAIHIWDLSRLTRIATLKGFWGVGIRVAFTPDGDRLLGSGWERMLRLWDWRTGQQLLQHPGRSSLSFGPDGRFLSLDPDGRFNLVELASGREYRSLVQLSAAGKEISYGMPIVHPGGRVFAIAMSDQKTRLFDLETGDELAALPRTGNTEAFQADGALLNLTDHGLLRWPIHKSDTGPWKLGPPKLVYRRLIDMASDRNGDVIGQTTGNGALLVRQGKPPAFLGPHGGAQHIAISPDGKYVATGVNEGDERVMIWDTKTRRLLKSFPTGRLCARLFSPDGQWLAVTGARGCQVLRVGTWEMVFADHWEYAAFSPDGALLAAETKQGTFRLLETSNGRELARLEDPNQTFGDCVFTPDSTRLLISSDNDKAVHVWDLRLIRAQLTEMGLDWDALPYPDADLSVLSPIKIQVDLGNTFVDDHVVIGLCSFRLALNPFSCEAYLERGRAYGHHNEPQKAVADYSMALALVPANDQRRAEMYLRRGSNYERLNDYSRALADAERLCATDFDLSEDLIPAAAELLNNSAWRCVTGPEKERDLTRALPLAQRAVKLDGDGWNFLNTLGVVYCRLEQYPRAVETLERSLRETQGEFAAFDQFFLAMCYAKQGATDKARESYDQAVKWVEQNPDKIKSQPTWNEELKRFRAEAEAVVMKKADK